MRISQRMGQLTFLDMVVLAGAPGALAAPLAAAASTGLTRPQEKLCETGGI